MFTDQILWVTVIFVKIFFKAGNVENVYIRKISKTYRI